MENVRNQIGFNKSFVVDNDGWSGGLAMFWKSNMKIDLNSFTRRHNSVKVK